MAGVVQGKQVVIASLVFAATLSASLWAGRQTLTLPQQRAAVAQAADDDDIYTGTILITPPRGDDCWQRYLDNHTGQIWDHGTVSCDAAALRSVTTRPSNSPRLEAIAKGFRGQ